jgi:hypothetical protein
MEFWEIFFSCYGHTGEATKYIRPRDRHIKPRSLVKQRYNRTGHALDLNGL